MRLLQALRSENALSVVLAEAISEHILANLRQLVTEDVYMFLRHAVSKQRDAGGLRLTLLLQRWIGHPRVTLALLQSLLGLVGLRAPLLPTVQDAWTSVLLHDDPEVRTRREVTQAHPGMSWHMSACAC